MPDFCHLHCHTQYSLLDGASDIKSMIKKAVQDGQQAVAITDHGNMFGAFKFVREAKKQGIKPIIGCEFYLVEDRHIKSFEKSKGQKDKRYHQLFLAKNEKGYQNLSKLCSLGFTEGLYGKYPRIDKELILQYHEGLIATSCCIGAEIPQTILTGNIALAEERLKWWIDIFGEDYYIELQRHRGMETIDDTGMSQEDVNQVLIQFAKKYNVKTIVSNDSHYIDEEDHVAHDILLCINTGSIIEDQKRFKFPSSDFYFKTQAEMNRLFADVPEAVDHTMEIASKVEELSLSRNVLLPAFPLPPEFKDQGDYLRHLTFQGAVKRYGILTPEIEERLNFELKVIIESGYPGYFLIVQDFTSSARHMGVSVGPGRGSAAGSAVAYCLGITNIDPIKYDLLFERFLNPERVSLPDIDIDFDDEGRGKVIDYVIDKYGQNQVAQIITYGTMAAKMALRDVGRAMNISIPEVDKVAKTFPKALDASLDKILAEQEHFDQNVKPNLRNEDVEKALEFRQLARGNDYIGEMIRKAKDLEGSVRSTGIHACGVIITPEDITNIVPVSVAKDSNMLVSQFDNEVAESAGLLKMDFLGLKTLTIIKDAVANVLKSKGIHVDIDAVDLEDTLTYELFQRGETIGIFQYESPGMQMYLKELQPTKFEDLIAMNALYRPGPLSYIPNFIARKNGKEAITYDLEANAEFLEETYGITVYQEQVMLLSQKLASFTKGEADVLRKAMGKKQKDVLDKMKPKFIEQAVGNGHDATILEKIWKDWEAFASYAFNKSHSTCYAFIAFQTAYLKAHYPAEFMAAVLNHNKNDITKLTFFIDEALRMGIEVLGPDVNESDITFNVTSKGFIRFGLSAIKGVGEGPVEEIVQERSKNGPFKDFFDMMRRLNLRAVNKKCIDNLVLSGALDGFSNIHRAQYFTPTDNYGSLIEHGLRYGSTYQTQKQSAQATLFGDSADAYIDEPKIPEAEEWINIDKLEKEREVIGIYLSGHPLDQFKLEMKKFVTHTLSQVPDVLDRPMRIAGIVTSVNNGVNQRGANYGSIILQDYHGSFEIRLNGEQYEKYKHLMVKGQVLYCKGINQKPFANANQHYFKIAELRLMEGMLKEHVGSLTLRLGLDAIDTTLIHEIDLLMKAHPGETPVEFLIVTPTSMGDQTVELKREGQGVFLDYSLIKSFEQLGLDYKLN